MSRAVSPVGSGTSVGVEQIFWSAGDEYPNCPDELSPQAKTDPVRASASE